MSICQYVEYCCFCLRYFLTSSSRVPLGVLKHTEGDICPTDMTLAVFCLHRFDFGTLSGLVDSTIHAFIYSTLVTLYSTMLQTHIRCTGCHPPPKKNVSDFVSAKMYFRNSRFVHCIISCEDASRPTYPPFSMMSERELEMEKKDRANPLSQVKCCLRLSWSPESIVWLGVVNVSLHWDYPKYK